MQGIVVTLEETCLDLKCGVNRLVACTNPSKANTLISPSFCLKLKMYHHILIVQQNSERETCRFSLLNFWNNSTAMQKNKKPSPTFQCYQQTLALKTSIIHFQVFQHNLQNAMNFALSVPLCTTGGGMGKEKRKISDTSGKNTNVLFWALSQLAGYYHSQEALQKACT